MRVHDHSGKSAGTLRKIERVKDKIEKSGPAGRPNEIYANLPETREGADIVDDCKLSKHRNSAWL